MKRIAFVTLLALCSTLMAAQVKLRTASIGIRMIDSTKVEAPYLTFGRTVYAMHGRPQVDYLLLMFREKPWDTDKWEPQGEIALLSLPDHQLLWTRPFNYQKQAVSLSRWGVLLLEGNNVSLLDKQTGETVWKQKMSLVKFDDTSRVVIGYKSNASSKLIGYDILTGKQMWTVKLPHNENWGWGDVIRDDSTHLLVTCNNLSRLNLLTGELQVHEAKTGVTDVKNALLQGLVAVAGAIGTAALTGGMYSYYPLYVGQNMITGLYSNVVKDDSVYFFSDRKHVACLDSTLNTIWQTELPAKTATHASLLVDDSLVYMFSYGYGVAASGPKKMGRPFIAAFDKRTGKELFMNLLTMKKDIVSNALLTPSGVYMMFDDGLAYQSDLRDPQTDISPWDFEQYGRLHGLRAEPFYVHYPLKGTFQRVEFDGQNCPVITDKGYVYLVNEHLEIRDRFDYYHLYYPIYEQDDRIWVSGPKDDLWVLHELGIPEYHITQPIEKICYYGEHLYLQDEKGVYIVEQLP